MAIYPGAKKRLIPKWNQVKMTRYRRMNLHVAVSESSSIYSIFARKNATVCSHFYVAKDGTVEQYIDTTYRSASDLHGNDSTISVETQGGVRNPEGERWTAAQVEALMKLWRWARDTHDIKNQVAKNTQTNENSSGLSWHRLGVDGNFSGRKGILSTSWKPGGILYSKARGKICPGDAKILQIPGIWEAANGKVTAPAKLKPEATKPQASKPKPSTGKGWPAQPLKITSKHTAESHEAWVDLLAAVGYKDKDLTKNFQRWLQELGYYPRGYLIDGIFGEWTVKALQSFLKSKKLYHGLIDGKRGSMTVEAEIKYLNLPANRGF